MTDAPIQPEAPPPAIVKARRGLGARLIGLIAIGAIVLVVALFGGLIRYGPLTPQGRLFLEARTNGLKLGPIGTLKIEGLSGDLWRDFSIAHLTISDPQGVWLDANNLHLVWRASELFSRRFHATALSADSIRLLKRPALALSQKKSGAAPVSLTLDAISAKVETLPAFSVEHGLFTLNATHIDVERSGGSKGQLALASLLHAGDHLNANFDLGQSDTIKLDLSASEAAGGALAGAMGLNSKQPFDLTANASGTTKAGKFSASSHSGPLFPIAGKGQWSAAGGGASLSLDLSASSLTKNYADMVGPHAYLVLDADKAQSGLQQVDLKAGGENLALTARGEVDVGKQRPGPQGLAITAATPNLDNITPFPKVAGPANVQATLTGGLSDWALAGKVSAQKVSALDYNLGSAAGPARLAQTKAGLEIDASLQGAGGGGTTWLAGLLGPTPSASAKLTIKGGRIAMRELHLKGAAITADGTGGRDLLGRLTFQGQGDLTNLAALRPEAKGSFAGSWSATDTGKGWNMTVDGAGAMLATGLDQLDRLLGPTPKLKMAAAWDDGGLHVSSGALSGAAGDLRATGTLGPNQSLAFKTDWNATGPFQAGPVEIGGSIKGGGDIAGTLSAPRLDLTADVGKIDLPSLPLTDAHLALTFAQGSDGADGHAGITGTSTYGAAHAAGDFRFIPGGVQLSGLDADAAGIKLAGSAGLRDGAPSSADLTVAIGKGLLLDAGSLTGSVKVVDAQGGPRATLALSGADLAPVGGAVTVRSLKLSGDGPLSALPINLDAQGRQGARAWTLSGQGTAIDDKGALGLDLNAKGSFSGAQLSTRSPLQWRSTVDGQSVKADLNLGGGEAQLDLLLGKATRFNATLKGVSLGTFEQDLTGAVDGSAEMHTEGGKLGGQANLTLTNARQVGVADNLALNANATAVLANDVVTLDAKAGNSSGLSANSHLVLPAETSAAPLRLAISTQKTIRGSFQAQGEVAPLWNLLVGEQRKMTGQVKIDSLLAGSLADLHILGTADLDNGTFADSSTGLNLQKVQLKAEFRDIVADVVSASASDGAGGTMTGEGRIGLRREGESTLTMNLNRFRLIDNDQARASASGQVKLDRDASGKVRLAGALNIDNADITAKTPVPTGVVPMDVVEVNIPDRLQDQTLALTQRKPLAVALNIDLNAARGVTVTGKGLDVELSLSSHVGGTTGAPTFNGIAKVVRGDYDFAGKRFTFDPSGTVALDTDPSRIRLNLSATRDDPSLTAIIKITGTAAKPQITLTSTPQLPSDEVLSQVLFGASAAQLSPLEAAQLASAVASLAGGGGFDVIGGIQNLAGLDRLAFAGGGDEGFTVAGGKYLTDNVYLEIIGGSREGPSAQVEWRVQKALSIISQVGSSNASLSVRWKRSY